MKILVLGQNGQVARCLGDLATDQIEIIALGREKLDLFQPESIESKIREIAPDGVINAAAYTAVDQAETDTEQAETINHIAVRHVGITAKMLQIPLVHISTDYVFPGDGDQPWKPNNPTGPLGVYGRSKLAGERALIDVTDSFAILRTSWVFSAYGNNFVKTMIRLGRERDTLSIVSDQIGGPTSARDIAVTALKILMHLGDNPTLSGTWHFAGRKDCSWADFATEIFTQCGISCAITGIPSSEYPTPATRPLNSRLDCTSTEKDFGIVRPEWKNSLNVVLKELGEIK